MTATLTDSPNALSDSRTLLRCSSTADFLAALPFATGFTDHNSLFIALFRGRRTSDILRVELPSPEAPDEQVEPLLDGLMQLLQDSGAGASHPALVITTAQSFAERRGVPYLRFARRIQRRMRREGWRLRELAVVASDGWAALLSDQPRKKRKLDEITKSAVVSVARESREDPSALDSLSALPERDESRARHIATKIAEVSNRRQALGAGFEAETDSVFTVSAAARVAEACFNPDLQCEEPADPRLIARLIDAAQSPSLWFAITLTALTRAEFVEKLAVDDDTSGQFVGISFSAVEAQPSDALHRPTMQQMLAAVSQEAPDVGRLRQVAEVVADAASHAPERHRPAVLALLAWVWWMLGMQSVAQKFVAQSHELCASHESTQMVESLISHPPHAHLRALRESYDS